MQLLQTSYFLPSLLATYISSFPLLQASHSSLFLHFPSFLLSFFHFNNPPPSLPQLLPHLFAWRSVKDADSVSRASRALLCPSRPGLRFVMLDNTRQCRDKTSATADKKSLVFSFPFHCLLHFSHGDAEFSGPFLSERRGMKIVWRKIVPLSLIYGLVIYLYKANRVFNFPEL